jgi:hypothetical protein
VDAVKLVISNLISSWLKKDSTWLEIILEWEKQMIYYDIKC